MEVEEEGESGLGSRASRRRNRERSVSVPSRPLRLFDGAVWDKQGTPAMISGRAPARARREPNAESRRAANVGRRAREDSERDSSDGTRRKGRRKRVQVHLLGRALASAE
jgi:hypothetical protein